MWEHIITACFFTTALTLVEVHRKTQRFVTAAWSWTVGLVVAESLIALAAISWVDRLLSGSEGGVWVAPTIAGILGSRVLSLIPIVGGVGGSRLVSVRAHVLSHIGEVALGARTDWLVHEVYPAAQRLEPTDLADLVEVSVRDAKRRGKTRTAGGQFRTPVDAEAGLTSWQLKVRSSVALLLDYGCDDVCFRIVTEVRDATERRGSVPRSAEDPADPIDFVSAKRLRHATEER